MHGRIARAIFITSTNLVDYAYWAEGGRTVWRDLRAETKKQIEQEPSTDFVSYRLGTWTRCPLSSVSLTELQSYFESIYDRHSNPQGPQVFIFSISTNLKWKCTITRI